VEINFSRELTREMTRRVNRTARVIVVHAAHGSPLTLKVATGSHWSVAGRNVARDVTWLFTANILRRYKVSSCSERRPTVNICAGRPGEYFEEI